MDIAINGLLFFGVIVVLFWAWIYPRYITIMEIGGIPFAVVGVAGTILYLAYLLYKIIVWLPNCPIHIHFT